MSPLVAEPAGKNSPVPPDALAAIGQIAVNVRDLARAVAFWRDRMGLRLLFEVPTKLAFFDCGGTHRMLALMSEVRPPAAR